MLPIPIGTDRPQRRIPWMNILLIAANLIVYMLTHREPVRGQAVGGANLIPGAEKWVLSAASPEFWQFLSYQFLHLNFMHIFGNMLFLYVFGNNLNEKLGHLPYLLLYLSGGVLAGCGQVLTSHEPTLGASGAISAVTGAFFVLLPRTNVRLFIWIIFYVDVLEIPSMYVILLQVLKDIFEQYVVPGSHVAHWAHLAGTFSGFAIAIVLLLAGLVQRDHYDLLAMIHRWRRRRAYESMVARGYNPFDPRGGVRPDQGAPVGSGSLPPAPPSPPPPEPPPEVVAARERVYTLLRARQVQEAAAAYLDLRELDEAQVLGASEQLDVANQLMSEGKYSEAAAAYEDYLRVYPGATQAEQVQLILGLIYARYWPNPHRAAELLRAALARLHDAGQRELAEAELRRLDAPPSVL